MPVSSALALLLAFATFLPATAQDDDVGHPAHVHIGTCSDLGEVAWALSDVGPGTIRNGVKSTRGKAVGQTEEVYAVDVSVTTVDTPLANITDGTYAINVHESADNIQNYIACGNIGGTQYGNTLIIGLGQLNDTGYTGIAVLRADGDQTVVTVYLEGDTPAPNDPDGEATSDGADDEEDATPAFGSDVAEEESVSIAGFAFGPDTLEISVGTTVTWTNEDSAPHTATADDGTFDSGRLDTGDTYSYTFDTPGTYTYTCSFHPNMTATIIVS
jgi:plastocyanin